MFSLAVIMFAMNISQSVTGFYSNAASHAFLAVLLLLTVSGQNMSICIFSHALFARDLC